MADRSGSGLPNLLRTAGFGSLCSVMGLGYVQQGLILTIAPLYVVFLGYSETVAGMLLAVFSVASVLGRPAFGRLTDRYRPRVVLTGGAAVAAVGAALHVSSLMWLLVVASVVRGVGWGALNTAGNAALVALAPPDRRGVASSIFNIFQNLGLAAAPALGLVLLNGRASGFQLVFCLAAGCAAVASLASFPLAAAPRAAVAVGLRGDYLRAASLPSALVGVFMLAQPAMVIFVPLYAISLGVAVGTASLYYVALAGCGIVARLLLGPFSDRFGRDRTILLGFAVSAGSLTVMAFAGGIEWIMVGGVLYAIGQALVVPAATAMAIDRVTPGGAGRVMGLFTGAFQAGMGAGALVIALIIDSAGYRSMYIFSAVGLGIVTLVLALRSARVTHSATTP